MIAIEQKTKELRLLCLEFEGLALGLGSIDCVHLLKTQAELCFAGCGEPKLKHCWWLMVWW